MDWIRKAIWPWLLCPTAGMLVHNQARATVTTRSDAEQGKFCLWTSPWQPSTSRLLSQLGLIDLARHHPDDAFSLLEQTDCSHSPIAQRLLALAELANQFAHTTELTARGDAILWSRDAAVYAVFCLATLDTNDEHLHHTASDIHNRALGAAYDLPKAINDLTEMRGQSRWKKLELFSRPASATGRLSDLTHFKLPINLFL